jgi:hypothetical protein
MPYNWQNKFEGDLPHGRDYKLHHINLRLRSNSPEILNLIHQVLYQFQSPVGEKCQPQINFGLQIVDNPSIPPPDFPSQLKLVSYDENQKLYSDEKGQLYSVSPNKFMVACNLKSLNAIGVISSDWAEYRFLIFHQVFYLMLAEMLKQLQMFNIHTAALAHNDIGILFPARARSGKSTITLSMLKAGFNFLSDDICFVQKNSSNLLLLGFPEPIKILEKTIKMFPELSFLLKSQDCKLFKKSLPVERVFPHSIQRQAIPRFLILPQIISSAHSELQPISKTDALVELIPQSLMVANKNIVKQHLEILTQLVDECQCFRLKAGQDVLDIPKLIKDIL